MLNHKVGSEVVPDTAYGKDHWSIPPMRWPWPKFLRYKLMIVVKLKIGDQYKSNKGVGGK